MKWPTNWQDSDTYWNDPLFKVDLSPSNGEFIPLPEHPRTFQARLDFVTESLRDAIATAPKEEQSGLVDQLVAWASHLAQNPLPKENDGVLPDFEDCHTEAV